MCNPLPRHVKEQRQRRAAAANVHRIAARTTSAAQRSTFNGDEEDEEKDGEDEEDKEEKASSKTKGGEKGERGGGKGMVTRVASKRGAVKHLLSWGEKGSEGEEEEGGGGEGGRGQRL